LGVRRAYGKDVSWPVTLVRDGAGVAAAPCAQ